MGDDWTTGEFDQEDESRFDDLDFGQGAADGKNLKAIEDDANNEVPTGEHLFILKKIEVTTVDREGQPTLRFYEAYMGADKTGYHSLGGRAVLALVSDPTKTISFNFRTPPSDPGELQVYCQGTSKPNGHKNGQGWFWKTLKHFLGHLGFSILDNGQLPKDATRFGAWKTWPDGKPRLIVAKIVAGTPMEGADPAKRVWNQIESYSFKDAPDTLARRGSRVQPPASGAGGAVAPATPTPTPRTPPIGQPVSRPAPARPATPASAPVAAGVDYDEFAV